MQTDCACTIKSARLLGHGSRPRHDLLLWMRLRRPVGPSPLLRRYLHSRLSTNCRQLAEPSLMAQVGPSAQLLRRSDRRRPNYYWIRCMAQLPVRIPHFRVLWGRLDLVHQQVRPHQSPEQSQLRLSGQKQAACQTSSQRHTISRFSRTIMTLSSSSVPL